MVAASSLLTRQVQPTEPAQHRPNTIPITAASAAKPEAPHDAVGTVETLQPRIAPTHSPRVALKTRGRIVFVNPSSVIAIEARGNYVLIQLENGSHLLRESISAVADKFQCYGFVRIHRSVVINPMYVRELEPQPTGDYVVKTHVGRREYLMTRTYRKSVPLLADVWVGATSS